MTVRNADWPGILAWEWRSSFHSEKHYMDPYLLWDTIRSWPITLMICLCEYIYMDLFCLNVRYNVDTIYDLFPECAVSVDSFWPYNFETSIEYLFNK